MREKIARYLRTYTLGMEEGYEGDCIAPWEDCDQFTQDIWLKEADQLPPLMTVKLRRYKNLAPLGEYDHGYDDGVTDTQANIKADNPEITFEEERWK